MKDATVFLMLLVKDVGCVVNWFAYLNVGINLLKDVMPVLHNLPLKAIHTRGLAITNIHSIEDWNLNTI